MKKLLILSILILTQMIWSQVANQPASGDGSIGNPYRIANLNNLYWITAPNYIVASPNQTERCSYHYIQTQDIDASATATWFSNNGWLQIGNYQTSSGGTQFTGSYDGGGYTISNLTINRTTSENIGLFGYSSGATIKNLGLTNVSINGALRTGGLVGWNVSGTITNCYSTGSVTGYESNGGGSVGGLVGRSSSNATINNCYSSATVNLLAENRSSVGGLVGFNEQGTITNCYSTGSVTGKNDVGGLVGNHGAGTISNCYSTGSVAGEAIGGYYVGGLVGILSGFGTISNCYSTGSVTGISSVGGLLGYNQYGRLVSNCFWDTQTSNQSSSANGTGKTTAEMTTGAHTYPNFYTAAGWDFKGESTNGNNDYWNINSTRNSGYPFLTFQFPSDDPLPVELTSFTANVSGSQVTLKWQTATEVNNYGFEIERRPYSKDGTNGDWVTVGFVLGSGNSNSIKEYSFTDPLSLKLNFLYRLKQIDSDGKFEYSREIEVAVNQSPTEFMLYQNYPNPFNPYTVIKYELPKANHVTLKVYDILGKEVAVLIDREQENGRYEVSFECSKLSSGFYICRITAGEYIKSIKMNLVK